MHGHEIAVGPDNHTVYMPIYGSSGVGSPGLDGSEMLVIDLPTRAITGRIDFGHGVRPHCVVYEPARGLVYVTTELDNSITVIDPKTLKIVGAVPTSQEQSHMLAITRDGKRGYTANVAPGTVSVLDLVAHKTIKVIPVSGGVQRIALSPNDKWVFTSDTTEPPNGRHRHQNERGHKRWIELHRPRLRFCRNPRWQMAPGSHPRKEPGSA